jgi:hypothetical protein
MKRSEKLWTILCFSKPPAVEYRRNRKSHNCCSIFISSNEYTPKRGDKPTLRHSEKPSRNSWFQWSPGLAWLWFHENTVVAVKRALNIRLRRYKHVSS